MTFEKPTTTTLHKTTNRKTNILRHPAKTFILLIIIEIRWEDDMFALVIRFYLLCETIFFFLTLVVLECEHF